MYARSRDHLCIFFSDINYQLAGADEKTAIFENWYDFLNYFDSSVNVQLSFINQESREEAKTDKLSEFERSIPDDTLNRLQHE